MLCFAALPRDSRPAPAHRRRARFLAAEWDERRHKAGAGNRSPEAAGSRNQEAAGRRSREAAARSRGPPVPEQERVKGMAMAMAMARLAAPLPPAARLAAPLRPAGPPFAQPPE